MDWETIARAHGPMAFETAWRVLGHVHDAEDAAQEALLDALRLHRDGGGVDNWGGMLRRLATCRALDRLRQRRARGRESSSLDRDVPSLPADRPDHAAAGRELAERLRVALADLPDRQATVFALRYFGELRNPEIAAALEISEHAVAVALNKARGTLARVLGVTGETVNR
jgi:RNA polymerase sigma-70 factor (ECF subfamily)